MSGSGVEGNGRGYRACRHMPACPSAESAGRLAAHVICDHLEQGWALLCNGIVVFDDAGALMPDGHALAPPLRVRVRCAATA
jgi:hypothetical protein